MDNGSKRLGAKTHLLKIQGTSTVDFHVNLNLYQVEGRSGRDMPHERCTRTRPQRRGQTEKSKTHEAADSRQSEVRVGTD
jgi:hypothetical protein